MVWKAACRLEAAEALCERLKPTSAGAPFAG
jgi:hypothetical protein